MPLYRQSGGGNAARIGVSSDHTSVSARGGSRNFQHRRTKGSPAYKISIGFCVSTLSAILLIYAFFYFSLQGGEANGNQVQKDDMVDDMDFLKDVTRIERSNELKFGRGSVSHGGDSRYWDKDDRRRDGEYSGEELEPTLGGSADKFNAPLKKRAKVSYFTQSRNFLDHRGQGLYNEAGRNELKMYEAEYEASLKGAGKLTNLHSNQNHESLDANRSEHEVLDDVDEYDDGIYLRDDQTEENDDVGHNDQDHSNATKPNVMDSGETLRHARYKKQHINEEADKESGDQYGNKFLSNSQRIELDANSGHSTESHSTRRLIPKKILGSKKKSKRQKISGSCDMKILNSTELLVEPVESQKFARFLLQYTETEEKTVGDETWEHRFSGHQSLQEREKSFIAHDQKINCGFVKGPKGSPSTGFDIAVDDAKYISSCHIAVASCIFGNSDRLRSPFDKTVSRLSRKSVCFVMFVDDVTLQTLSSEGQMPDIMGYVGLWKIVLVKNLPYTDMRRVGKIPKFLAHRLFPKARYSIWLDSKLRLQLDPMLILEYFLWRKGYEYAISNHYARHCLWEEIAQNKKLNKYNHSVIDEQFAFYQADGMKRFNVSAPDQLLPSNVPEGSFIVRAHTPMSNLFSCLWFNEVDRFTPRDQLSFAYIYYKLRRMNPEKPFRLHMFKDCERRKIAKLFHHRSEEKRTDPGA